MRTFLACIVLIVLCGTCMGGKKNKASKPDKFATLETLSGTLTESISQLQVLIEARRELIELPVFTSPCCPDTWVAFQDSCYLFHRDNAVNFHEAQRYCEQYDAVIVHAETIKENTFLKDHLKGLLIDDHWLGLTDKTVESTWKWYGTDTVPAYTDWYPGEPNNVRASEDCVIFGHRNAFAWVDVPCTAKFQPICERKKV